MMVRDGANNIIDENGNIFAVCADEQSSQRIVHLINTVEQIIRLTQLEKPLITTHNALGEFVLNQLVNCLKCPTKPD